MRTLQMPNMELEPKLKLAMAVVVVTRGLRIAPSTGDSPHAMIRPRIAVCPVNHVECYLADAAEEHAHMAVLTGL